MALPPLPNLSTVTNYGASAIVQVTKKSNNAPKDHDSKRREEEGRQMAQGRKNPSSSGKK